MKAAGIRIYHKSLKINIFQAKASIATLLACLIFLPLRTGAQGQRIGWAEQLTGDLGLHWMLSATQDPNANLFFSDAFAVSNITFGNQTLTNHNSAPNAQSTFNGFVAKYDSGGNFQWVRQIGGDGRDVTYDCAADALGNVFVTGFFVSTNLLLGTNLLNAQGSEEMFVVKFDPQGNVLWARQTTGTSVSVYANGTSVATDTNGNVLVAGSFSSSNLLIGTNLLTNPTPGSYPDLLAKYSSAGDLLWVKQINAPGGGWPHVGVDGAGNGYLTDIFSATADFGTATLNSSGGGGSLFLAKYDPTGNLTWAREEAYGTPNLYEAAIAVNSWGDVRVFGGLADTGDAIFPTGTVHCPTDLRTAFLAGYDSSGNSLWVTSFTGDNEARPRKVVVDPIGNCYASGYSYGHILNFSNLILTNSDPYPYHDHPFVVKYATNGSLLWTKWLNSPGVYCDGIASVDSRGNAYLFGTAYASNSFDLGGAVIYGPTKVSYYYAARIDGPSLSLQPVGNQLVISWPTNAAGLKLETSASPTGGPWSPVTNAPATNGDQYVVTNLISAAARYYRLRNY